jgi:hypothetical protein
MEYLYLNVRGQIIQLDSAHFIFTVEDSYLNKMKKHNCFTKENPFYLNINPYKFHKILSLIDCDAESKDNYDKKFNQLLSKMYNEYMNDSELMYILHKLEIIYDNF